MPVFYTILILICLLFIIVMVYKWLNKDTWVLPKGPFKEAYRDILKAKVNFYTSLRPEEQTVFEYRVQEFLLNHRITGIECDVSIEDNLLVAASAIIPVFKFPEWRYTNLYEVFLYPDHFNDHHEVKGKGRTILGMVGTGVMDGKMILSKRALHHGFDNASDKKNTAIHEFVHLIDKMDGQIDGIPAVLLEKQYAIPWLALMEQKIEEIYQNRSDINPYGGTSKIEFFAVASEYFFERPKHLSKTHPELYRMLKAVYDQDMKMRQLKREKLKISRNDLCPCDSQKKFKHCCGRAHYK